MCEISFSPVFMDDALRLALSIFLLLCCIVLGQIFAKRKAWDEAFWVCYAGFLACLAGYGYLVQHIYLQNTFSYDGFISSAAIITVFGLLFSNHGRYVEFSDSVFSKNGPIFFATFILFSLIYLSTVNYNFQCVPSKHQFFVDVL